VNRLVFVDQVLRASRAGQRCASFRCRSFRCVSFRALLMSPRCRRAEGGFTLLEILVSLAILAMALVVLVRITTKNIQATNRAKLVTAATFLARGKIVEIEDRILALGFVDVDEEETGNFGDDGYGSIGWETLIEKIELPTDLGQLTQQASGQLASDSQSIESQNPLQFIGGMMGGLMSTIMDPIRIGLEESVRRITVTVYWDELGRGEQSLQLVTFVTDPARLSRAMGLPRTGAGAAAPGAAPAARGQ